MNSTVLHFPEHHGNLVGKMPSTISRPRVLVLYSRSGKLEKLLQFGWQDSGHVTVAVVSLNPGLDCMLIESTTDDETRRWRRLTPCEWLAAFPHYCTDPDVTGGNGRGAPWLCTIGRICNPCTGLVAMTTQREREMSASAFTRSMPGYNCNENTKQVKNSKIKTPLVVLLLNIFYSP